MHDYAHFFNLSVLWRNTEEIDHIFPRSELTKRGYDESEINNVANFWILAKGKNINKSNKPPAEYFKDVSDEEMKAALIDRELLDYSRFRGFLKKRGKEILEFIKARLGFTNKEFRTPSPVIREPRHIVKLPPARISGELLTSAFSIGGRVPTAG